jgi:hypothetical protein
VVSNDIEVSKRAVGFSRRGRMFNSDYFTAKCTYEYEIGGQRFKQTKICAEGFDRDEVNRLRRPYSVGAEIAVYYWPRRPQDSVLTTKSDSWGMGMMLGFGLAAIPGGLVMISVAAKMRPQPPQSTVRPAANVPSRAAQEAVQRGVSPISKTTVAGRAAPRVHWLLRALSICVGTVFVLIGGVFVAACFALMAKGPEAKVGMTVQIVALVIFALMALFGAFLIWMGLGRRSRAADIAIAQPMERSAGWSAT